MPELPEVETLARHLESLLLGARFARVDVSWEREIATPGAEELRCALPGLAIVGVGRYGKFLILSLSDGRALLFHLRMSGSLRVEAPGVPDDPYARVVFALDDGRRLVFSDPRKFGRVYLVDEASRVIHGLGPDALDAGLTLDQFGAMLAGRRGALKPLLLNQRFLAGLGNIYVDESLFRAGLHPLRRATTLSPAEVQCLYEAIRYVLCEAVANRGTTMRDRRYLDAQGQPGGQQECLQVYQRAGEACPRCGDVVERIVVGGRGTHFCVRCQH